MKMKQHANPEAFDAPAEAPSAPAKRARKAGKGATPRRLYFAYGANTNKASMARRCPDARPVCVMKLDGHRLAFRGVADVVPASGECVFGVLWEITDRCEAALDRFEGFPTMYGKEYGKATLPGGEVAHVMWYTMNADPDHYQPPYEGYEATLRVGYADFGLPVEQLDLAILRAVDAAPARGLESFRPGRQWRRA